VSSADCIFCGIAQGRVVSSPIADTERALAFADIQPVTPGHALVVPRRHAARLGDLDPEDGAELFRLGQRVAVALYASSLRCEGVNFFVADGEVAGQEVFHVHLHVFPRFVGDGLGLRIEGDYRIRPRPELDETAARIREAWPR
jgi:diadenosine tetraphosphate (Ap4A) HIT family hydrolase